MKKKSTELIDVIRNHLNENFGSMSEPKEALLESIFLLDDCRSVIEMKQRNNYNTLVDLYPEDAEAWYLYSLFARQIEGNIDKATSYAEKSIEVLSRQENTVSAFSKNFIELQIIKKNYIEAADELSRISSLKDLTFEQKLFFSDSLKILKKNDVLPKEFRDIIS